MDHVITFKDILIAGSVIGGLFVVGVGLLALLSLLNPFRSGH